MKALFAGMVATVAMVLVLSSTGAAQKDKDEKKEPKYKISEVMQKAMKGGLCKKCASGDATAAEKKMLVEMFIALHENTPPKGEKDSWAKVTKALVDAAKAVDEGKDEAAGKSLAKLVNCGACHKEFKGK